MRLIDQGTTEQDVTRRRAALSEFSLADATSTRVLRETADAFIAARLLTTNEIAGTTTIEVSHEAVIREWRRLAEWTREGREDIHLLQVIREDAAEWRRYGQSVDRLYRGTQLTEALAWRERSLLSLDEEAFLNFALQVQMTIIRGPSGGLLFRSNLAGTFYAFSISTDGTYFLERISPGSIAGKIQITPLARGSSPAINQGINQSNTLTVVAQGNTLYLYVNGQYVDSASDSTLTSGAIGVFTLGAEAAFSNLKVSMVTFGYPEMGEVEGIRQGGMITVIIHMSPAREPLYLPTLVSSNAPRAHSDAFCASVRPRMPVMLSRS